MREEENIIFISTHHIESHTSVDIQHRIAECCGWLDEIGFDGRTDNNRKVVLLLYDWWADDAIDYE